MRVLVTGAHGQVGRATVEALRAAKHDVTATDLGGPDVEPPKIGELPFLPADLTDDEEALAVTRGHDAVVHAAAIPSPGRAAPDVVFHNNVMATFNTIEAAIRCGVARFVNISSLAVLGWFYAEREVVPEYLPVDEEHPVRAQDPYGLAKHFGEQLMSAAAHRSVICCTSLRLGWIQRTDTYERNLASQISDASPDPASWTYVDVRDVADAIRLAVECELPAHEVLNVAAPDNPGGHDFAASVRVRYGDSVPVRGLERSDGSAVNIAKARRLLDWEPAHSWRDYLDAHGHAWIST
jgi:nucleoside-diphosphate-sugar epimerase